MIGRAPPSFGNARKKKSSRTQLYKGEAIKTINVLSTESASSGMAVGSPWPTQ